MNLKKEIWRLVLIIALCAWLAPAVCTAQRTATVDTSFYVRYPYILFVESEADVAPLSDEAFISLAAPIIFPVNQYALPEQDKMFREIADEVIPQLNRDSMRVRRMVFRGAASPEGPYRWNQFLSERRAAALADYVQGATAFPPAEHFVTTLVEVEDYPLLCAMMKRAGDADYAMVRSLCEKYPTKESTEPLKRALQQAQGGFLDKVAGQVEVAAGGAQTQPPHIFFVAVPQVAEAHVGLWLGGVHALQLSLRLSCTIYRPEKGLFFYRGRVF